MSPTDASTDAGTAPVTDLGADPGPGSGTDSEDTLDLRLPDELIALFGGAAESAEGTAETGGIAEAGGHGAANGDERAGGKGQTEGGQGGKGGQGGRGNRGNRGNAGYEGTMETAPVSQAGDDLLVEAGHVQDRDASQPEAHDRLRWLECGALCGSLVLSRLR